MKGGEKYMIKVTIKGTNNILLHKYTVTSTKPGPRSQIANYSDEWKKGTYLDMDNKYVILPWQNLMASIFDGCKGERLGKLYLTRLVHTSLRVLEDSHFLIKGKKITLQDIEDNDWIYLTGAVITGRRIDRSRTMLPKGWEATFMLWNKEPFDLDLTKRIIETAGERAGIGDWRPSAPKKPGPYGTFEVVDMAESKD